LSKYEFKIFHDVCNFVLQLINALFFTIPQGWGVWIRNDPDKGKTTFRTKRDDLVINKGDYVTFRFRISWFTGEPKPEVISLIWDGEQLCSDNGISVRDIKAARARRYVNRNIPGRMRFPIN